MDITPLIPVPWWVFAFGVVFVICVVVSLFNYCCSVVSEWGEH